jgi:threonine aldolase
MHASLEAFGVRFLYPSATNQRFPILDNDKVEKLSKKFVFENWVKIDEDHTAIRLCTSFATKEADVDEFVSALNEIFAN